MHTFMHSGMHPDAAMYASHTQRPIIHNIVCLRM